MKRTNNPLFSSSASVVHQALSKKCNINQKELFNTDYFMDSQWFWIYHFQYSTIRLSPLQYACLQRNEDVALLLIDAGADIHIFDVNQTSILQMATMSDAVSLIDKIADLVDINYYNSMGSALHIACAAQKTEAALCLLSHGANANLKVNGCTPIQISCNYYNKHILAKMLETQKIPLGDVLFSTCMSNNVNPIKFLEEHGAKLSYKNRKGSGLIHAACSVQGPSIKVIQYLIDRGLPVNTVDKYGNTPLHLACASHNFKAIELLLSHSADVNTKNSNGETPLVYSAKSGQFHLKLYRLLKEYNVDLSITDSESKALFDYISKQQKQAILNLAQL